jgi:peptide/nickel transport system substrate-binding protein
MHISPLKASIAVVVGLMAALAIAACGSGGGGGEAKKGGTVTILDTAGGVDSLDPGYWYYQTDTEQLGQTTTRTLYGWKPDDTTPRPDLAEALPKASNGGKTLTIKIKSGIKYSAPLQNRAVKTADVKYAIERCFLPQVANGYVGSYYSDIVGVEAFQSGKAKEVSGIQAPNATTLVIKTTVPSGVLASGGALSLNCTTPVPKDYAQKYDQGKQSTYGQHQVFLGPYMIENDGKGNITGYKPGKTLTLVRNPNWDKASDFKPAYFDRIEFKGGFDAAVAARTTLTGQGMLSGDYAAPPTSVLKQALSSRKSQVQVASGGGFRYISLNTKVKPLENLNVRRALNALVDKTALRQTRGGPTLGPLATHLIPPGLSGHDEAGGVKGPGFDFVSQPSGNLQLAMQYMKKAGYSSGKYNGPALLTVADNQAPAKQTGEAFQNQVGKLGFKLQYREVPHATLLSKFCLVPKAAVAMCPTLGWGTDFLDTQSMIDPLFNGKNIVPSGNTNVSQVNDPAINAEIDKAKQVLDPTQRGKAWAELDKKLTNQGYFITWLWDNQIRLASTNVKGVGSKFNNGAWDLTFSALK